MLIYHRADTSLETMNRILRYDKANRRDILSLRNWLGRNGSIARKESAYLGYHDDLFTLAPVADNAKVCLEAGIEDRLGSIFP